MTATTTVGSPTGSFEIGPLLHQLRNDTILLVLPALYLVGLGCFVLAGRLDDPLQGLVPCLVALALGVIVWALRRVSYSAAAWALVLGGALVDLLVARGLNVPTALSLLALPAGLAALFVGVPAAALLAAACSLLLLYGPTGLVAAGQELRLTTVIGIWGTIGLIWLTLRPLLTTLEWSWSSHEQSQRLLEQARDQRVQLKQALADLADANLQMTRLNQLTQSLRQAAEDARRAKEQFVANVSHELRTPLNMVIGFTETILQAPQTYGERIPAALLADLAVILRNSQHLSSLIDDVLDLSQIEAGQMAVIKERVSLSEIVEAAATGVRPLFDSKKLYLETEVPADLPPIFCDRTRMREVLLNLLSNAGRFTERGGVRLRARQEGGDVVVSVADTGPGIAASDKERLFRPFEQLDGSIRRRYGGTGLGLAISRSFVELHGGRMWLESQVGQGTTFFFRLPIDPPRPIQGDALHWLRPEWEFQQRTRPSTLPSQPLRPRLVVLEAGQSLQRLLRRYLGEVEIAPVADLQQAEQELVRVPAQALLINDAPIGAALERLHGGGRLPHGTPVVICPVPGAHEAASTLGVAEYLLKPVSREALLAALDRLHLDGKTLLVVDDEPEAARLFRRMLNSSGKGYRILTANDGCEALAILRQERPDALLLDLIMPEMDGFQLLAEKRADAAIRSIPVLIVSASDPAGQPVVTNGIAISRGGGLAMRQVLACLEAISGTGLCAAPPADPTPPAVPPG